MAWQDPAHRALAERCLRPERVGERRLDIADRQAAHEPGDDQALQGVRAADPDSQKPRGERLVGSPQLRPLERHRPGGGLDRGRAVAVTAPGLLPRTARVALAAEELGHLGLERGLHQKAHAEARHLL